MRTRNRAENEPETTNHKEKTMNPEAAAAVSAELREFVGHRNGGVAVKNNDAKKSGRVRGGVEDLMKMSEYLRESGWDDSGSRLLRRRLARTGGKSA